MSDRSPNRTPLPAMSRSAPPRGAHTGLLIGLVLATATLAAYARVAGNEFVNYDDDVYITQNADVLRGLSWPGARWALTTPHAANRHPLTWLSLQLDASLYGRDLKGATPTPIPWGYHVSNLLLHIANGLLLFGVLWQMTGAIGCSAFVAGVFLLHPLHVESVAWAAERKDVLSTLFWMLTLWAYARYALAPSAAGYLAVVVALALGLAAKPMVVTLPVVLLLLDYWPLRRAERRSRLVVEKLPLFIIVAAAGWLTWQAQSAAGATHTLEQLPLLQRLANAGRAYVLYPVMAVYPVGLSPFYPFPSSISGPTEDADGLVPWLLISLIVLPALTGAAIGVARRRPSMFVGCFWYLVTLVPVIGIIQVGRQALADRYTYVPLIGLTIAAAWGVNQFAARLHVKAIAVVAATCVLATCAVATWIQAGYWQSSMTLWNHTLAVTKGNYLAHYNLGKALDERGRIDEALDQFQFAIRIRPDYSEAHDNVGVILENRGELDKARERFGLAVQYNPANAYAHNNLGHALSAQGALDGAADHFAEAIRLKPDFAMAYANLGVTRSLQGDHAAALENFRQAVELSPGSGKYHYYLAHALDATGHAADARAEYQAGLRLDPRWLATMNEVAWSLATDPDSKKRNSPMAIFFAEQAVGATAGRNADALDTLAAAYADGGRFGDAQRAGRQATSLAAGHPTEVAAIEARLHLYDAGKPFRAEPGQDKWGKPR